MARLRPYHPGRICLERDGGRHIYQAKRPRPETRITESVKSYRRLKVAGANFTVYCICIQHHKKRSYEPHFPTPDH